MSEFLLGGKVECAQPVEGYRAGLDAVLLGASIHLKTGQKALDIGTGSGAAMLVAAFHNEGATFKGIDIQERQIGLARENIAANGFAGRMTAEVRDITRPVNRLYDQVFANPPYFDDDSAIRPPSQARAASFIAGDVDLAYWVDAALRMTAPKGYLTFIHRTEALPIFMAGFAGRAGDIRIRAVQSYADEPAIRILVRARKAAKSPLTLLPPIVLHRRSDVVRDYLPDAAAVLSGEAQLEWD